MTRVHLGMRRFTKTADAKLAIIRAATTNASSKYSSGGVLKEQPRNLVKPVTLPRLKFMEKGNGIEDASADQKLRSD
jgi:hypothetical protein